MITPQLRTAISDARPAWGERPLLYRFEANLEIVPIGIVPEGLRLSVAFDGRITAGILEGARVWGVDPLLLRRDGVGVIDAPKTIFDGRIGIFEHARGYCRPPEGLTMPPLEALLEPGFTWPDVLFPIQGFSLFRAAAPELAFLNDAVASIEGWASFASGRLAIETRITERAGAVAGPSLAA